MYLIDRQKKILTFLLTASDWVTGAEIARKLGITDRTVRKDVRDINMVLRKYPETSIEAIRGTGYLLRTANRELLMEQLRGNDDETPKDRMANLALEILETEDPVSLEDLEEEFFISRTTLEVAIRQINDKSIELGIGPVIRHKRNAVVAECTERDRRELMRSFLLSTTERTEGKLHYKNGQFRISEEKVILSFLRNVLRKYKLKVTDLDMTEMVFWLYVQKIRVLKGNILSKEREGEHVPETIRYITEEVIMLIEKNENFEYPEQEIKEFAFYLKDVRLMKEERFAKKEIMSVVDPCYIVIVEELLYDIKTRFMIDFTQDESLFVDLVMHIRYSLKSNCGLMSQETSVLDIIKDRYPFVFELSTYIFGRIYDVLGIEMNEVQLSYVAAHLGAALERLENTNSTSDFKIAVCSNMSMGIVGLLMTKLHSIYQNQANIIGPYPLYETEKMLKDNPSLILTTNLYGMFEDVPVPVITISPMLETEDVQAINEKIKRLRHKAVVLGLEKGVDQYFDRELFFPQLDLDTREEVLDFLCSKIVEKGYAPVNLLEDVLERERIAPTTLSNYMAMPHPIHMCAYKTVIAVATLKKNIQWGKQNVRVVFLLIVRSSDMKYFSGFFDITSNLVNQKKKVQKLLEIDDYRKFVEELVPMRYGSERFLI